MGTYRVVYSSVRVHAAVHAADCRCTQVRKPGYSVSRQVFNAPSAKVVAALWAEQEEYADRGLPTPKVAPCAKES